MKSSTDCRRVEHRHLLLPSPQNCWQTSLGVRLHFWELAGRVAHLSQRNLKISPRSIASSSHCGAGRRKNVFIWQQGIWVIRSSNSFQIRALLGCFSPQAEIHSASRMRSWHLFMLLLALERSVREKTSIPTWILKEMKQDIPCWCWADII